LQAKGKSLPAYNTIELSNNTFQSSVNIDDVEYVAEGKSKKIAEANVAKIILERNGIKI